MNYDSTIFFQTQPLFTFSIFILSLLFYYCISACSIFLPSLTFFNPLLLSSFFSPSVQFKVETVIAPPSLNLSFAHHFNFVKVSFVHLAHKQFFRSHFRQIQINFFILKCNGVSDFVYLLLVFCFIATYITRGSHLIS